MKKLVFLFAMVLASAMVFAQNTATIDQNGGILNSAYTQQIGTSDLIFVKQVVADPAGLNTAGVDAVDRILQNGNGNIARVDQEVANVPTAGNISENLLKINQVGHRNRLVGATSSGYLGNDNSNALQYSSKGSNTLNVNQHGGNDNSIGLYQHGAFTTAFGSASAAIEQDGHRNELVVYQNTTGHPVEVDAASKQIGNDNVARLVQKNGNGSQKATIQQYGDRNFLVGANSSGTILDWGVAMQNTGDALGGRNNNLLVSQSGNDNMIGLNQYSTGDSHSANYADIDQTGGGNQLGAYQYTNGASSTPSDNISELFVTQTGGDIATVLQNGIGTNTATVIQ
jgi:hypothetical protein